MMTSEAASAQKETESPRHESTATAAKTALNGNFAARTAAGFLGDVALSGRANAGVRTLAMRQMQQTHGNHFAQRAVSGRLIQRHCACGGSCEKCRAEEDLSTSSAESTVESARLIQREAAGPSADATAEPNSHSMIPPGRGEPLDDGTREFMESRFGTDFSRVRIHTDPPAAASAKMLNANAYATGSDIYFAEGKYSPQTQEGQHLIAHELTHTVHQGEVATISNAVATKGSDSVAVGRVDDPLEQQAEHVADLVMASGVHPVDNISAGQTPAIRRQEQNGGIGDYARAAWHATGGRVVGALKEGAEQIVRRMSPELADLIAQGPMAFVKGLIHTAITQWIPSLPGGSNLIEIAQAVIQGFNKAFALIAGVAKGDAKSCQAFADMLTAVRDAGLKILESSAVQRLKETVSEINHTVAKFLSLVIAPQFEMLSSVLGGAWQFIKAAASKVSGWFKKVRSAVGRAWDWVLEKLGFSGPEDENGVWAWIKRKADQIWTGIKETLAPLVGPLKTVGKTLFTFSGLGQIYLLVKYGPKVVEAVQWLWAHRNDPDIIRSAHKEMGDTILPGLLEGVAGFKKTLHAAVDWFKETVTSLSTSVLELLGAITNVPLLSIAKELVRKAAELFQKLVTWADSEFQSAVKWVTEVVQKITNFVAPYKEILSSLALAAMNPAMIPPILAGWAWQAVPHCIRVPIINFILDIVIGAMEALPDLPMFGPLWLTLKPGVVAFLRRIRTNATDAEKEQISIKIAKIIRGSSLDFLLGFAKGVLKGVWEGITDPIKAIWMVMEGLTWVMDYLDSLANAALGGGTKQTAGPAASAVPATGQSRTAPPSLPGALSPAGQMPVSKLPMSTTPLAASSPASPTSATTSPAPATAMTAAANSELGESVKDFASSIRPDVDKVLGDFWSAVEEYFSGGKGVTYEDLVAKFGELWSTIQGKIKEMGGELADKVVKFFTSGAEADDTLGEGIGWLVGTVAFQLLLDFITAGGWAAAGPVVKAIAKFINWPMEFMGEAFKLLGKLGGYIVDGLKSLGRMVKETGGGALKAVTEAMGNIGKKLVSFAEQLLGRFGGAAAREGTQLAEREAAALAEKEAAKLAEKETGALAEREAATVTEKEAGKLAEKEGAEAAEKKATKEAGEKGEKATIEEAAEQPVAKGLAVGIEESMEAKGASIGALLGGLELLKTRFKWVKGFEAQREGAAYMVYMLSSRIPLLPYRSVRVNSQPPNDYREVETDYSMLRDAAGNIDSLPEGVVYKFPGGHRVWREGAVIRHDTVLGPSVGRRANLELDLPSAAKMGRPELAGMERAHTLGQGTGFESPFGILFAPREVNQIIQNNGIEEFMRGLQASAHPGEAFHLSTMTVPHSGTLRLKEIRYRVEVSRDGGRDFLFEYVINVGNRPDFKVTHEIANITQNPDIAHYFDLVDVPERLRSRFKRFYKGAGK